MSEEKDDPVVTFISQRCGLPGYMVLDLLKSGWRFEEEYNQPSRFVAPMPSIHPGPAPVPLRYQIQPRSVWND